MKKYNLLLSLLGAVAGPGSFLTASSLGTLRTYKAPLYKQDKPQDINLQLADHTSWLDKTKVTVSSPLTSQSIILISPLPYQLNLKNFTHRYQSLILHGDFALYFNKYGGMSKEIFLVWEEKDLEINMSNLDDKTHLIKSITKESVHYHGQTSTADFSYKCQAKDEDGESSIRIQFFVNVKDSAAIKDDYYCLTLQPQTITAHYLYSDAVDLSQLDLLPIKTQEIDAKKLEEDIINGVHQDNEFEPGISDKLTTYKLKYNIDYHFASKSLDNLNFLVDFSHHSINKQILIISAQDSSLKDIGQAKVMVINFQSGMNHFVNIDKITISNLSFSFKRWNVIILKNWIWMYANYYLNIGNDHPYLEAEQDYRISPIYDDAYNNFLTLKGEQELTIEIIALETPKAFGKTSFKITNDPSGLIAPLYPPHALLPDSDIVPASRTPHPGTTWLSREMLKLMIYIGSGMAGAVMIVGGFIWMRRHHRIK